MPEIRRPKGPPLIGIVGWKNSGKTTLATSLIGAFTRRGLRVASVKHAHHDFQIDNDETDSARHRRAGAAQVAVVSSRRWALVTELGSAPEPDLADIVARLEPCDLIIVEGYKAASIPKIEARRRAARDHRPLSGEDPNVIAIAADHPVPDERLPVFDLSAIEQIADFIAGRFALAD
ncbi:MAG: molybdopterin-guanine dinucleotide biosynthesis protein B [Hyphomicrobiaceae bacterium]